MTRKQARDIIEYYGKQYSLILLDDFRNNRHATISARDLRNEDPALAFCNDWCLCRSMRRRSAVMNEFIRQMEVIPFGVIYPSMIRALYCLFAPHRANRGAWRRIGIRRKQQRRKNND